MVDDTPRRSLSLASGQGEDRVGGSARSSESGPPACGDGDARPPQISLLYVEDHAVVREAVGHYLDLQPDLSLVASAATGAEGVELFSRHHPDVTLVDLQLPDMSGIDVIRRIRQVDPAARIVMLSMHGGDEDISRALAAGAASYVLKDTVVDELTRVLRQVHAGEDALPDDVATRLAARQSRPPIAPRECQVLTLIAGGIRDRQIASSLGISEETVHGHVKSILAKLGVTGRTAAVAVAMRRGIIPSR